jgi:hypothetical protein
VTSVAGESAEPVVDVAVEATVETSSPVKPAIDETLVPAVES